MRRNEVVSAIARVLEGAGIVYAVHTGGKHMRIEFWLNGQRRRYFCPKTGSDWRGPIKAKCDVRRMLRGDGR